MSALPDTDRLDDVQGPLAGEVARNREVLLRLLSVTASLAGLGVAALGLMEYGAETESLRTVADEIIAADVLLFVLCVYLILWALRTRSARRALQLSRIVDFVFLLALTTLVLAGGYIVYWVL
jgi:hypothetical protein